MKINNDQRQNIKRVPIIAYLASKGIFPVLESGGEYCYFSPFRKEKTPSFFVNVGRNLFNDFGEGVGGDNIKLVTLLSECGFLEAMRILYALVDADIDIKFMDNLPANPQYQSFVKRITPLKHKALLQYLVRTRLLNEKVVMNELSEIHYSTSRGDFFSAGFKNESGGWELRNPSFKGCIGQKDISIRGDKEAAKAMVFEGFIDYLSYRSCHRDLGDCYYILNSTSLVARLPELAKHNFVVLFLDNDDSGKKAANKLVRQYPKICTNASEMLYPEYEDYNAYLQASEYLQSIARL